MREVSCEGGLMMMGMALAAVLRGERESVSVCVCVLRVGQRMGRL